jgi:hypothetical protein
VKFGGRGPRALRAALAHPVTVVPPAESAGRVGRVKRHALPPLEAAREVCSADGPDDGDPGRSQANGSYSIPEPEAPAGGTSTYPAT